MEHTYLVCIKTINETIVEKEVKHYQDAMCYATNYLKIKTSKIIRDGQVVTRFKF